MIVRVMADNQYRIDDTNRVEMAAVDHLDDELVAAVEANQEAHFHEALTQLIAYVHRVGQVVPRDEVIPSDLMIPAADMTVAEARSMLQLVGVG